MNPTTASFDQLMALVQTAGQSPVADQVMTPVGPSDAAARAFHAVWSTDQGRILIEHLLDVTVRRLDMPLLGLSVDQVAIYAAYREGLRDAGVTLLRLAERGRDLAQAPSQED